MSRRVLIKIGGKAFDRPECFSELARSIKRNPFTEFIIVHGGGAEISQALRDADRETHFFEGIRITRAEDIDIIESVLSNINSRIAEALIKQNVPCRSLSGKTESMVLTRPLRRKEQVFGFVGEIVKVNPVPVLKTFADREIPVISPISIGEDGLTYNVNADSAAAAIAVAAGCTDLIYFTDVPGVEIDGELCSGLTIAEASQFMDENKVSGGMVAKLNSAFSALMGKVAQVHILKWQGEKTLYELQSGGFPVGTTLYVENHDASGMELAPRLVPADA